MTKQILIILSVVFSTAVLAQPQLVRVNPQHHFRSTVPAGNYSGITYLGDNRYAVVDDKYPNDGFAIFHIHIDEETGDIINVVDSGFVASRKTNRDSEGICFFPANGTLFIAGEADNRVLEYTLDGNPTGRELNVPQHFHTAVGNYGLESLTYNSETHRFWITSESTLPMDGKPASETNRVKNRLRLQSFNDSLQPCEELRYEMDFPSVKTKGRNYAIGVSEIACLDSVTMLVMERELYVSKNKLGSFVVNKIYSVNTHRQTEKQLVAEWKTRINLIHQDFANYEGMCLGPRLKDGSRVVVLCADSQNQYGSVLRDWFRTIVIK